MVRMGEDIPRTGCKGGKEILDPFMRRSDNKITERTNNMEKKLHNTRTRP